MQGTLRKRNIKTLVFALHVCEISSWKKNILNTAWNPKRSMALPSRRAVLHPAAQHLVLRRGRLPQLQELHPDAREHKSCLLRHRQLVRRRRDEQGMVATVIDWMGVHCVPKATTISARLLQRPTSCTPLATCRGTDRTRARSRRPCPTWSGASRCAWCTALDRVGPNKKLTLHHMSPSLCCLTWRLSRVSMSWAPVARSQTVTDKKLLKNYFIVAVAKHGQRVYATFSGVSRRSLTCVQFLTVFTKLETRTKESHMCATCSGVCRDTAQGIETCMQVSRESDQSNTWVQVFFH